MSEIKWRTVQFSEIGRLARFKCKNDSAWSYGRLSKIEIEPGRTFYYCESFEGAEEQSFSVCEVEE
jgi:hypothetical protein